jgi:hypothetical protein
VGAPPGCGAARQAKGTVSALFVRHPALLAVGAHDKCAARAAGLIGGGEPHGRAAELGLCHGGRSSMGSATGVKRFMVWRQASPQALMTQVMFANIGKALESLNVRS